MSKQKARDLLKEAQQALELKDVSRGVDLLKEAIEEDSENVEVWVLLAQHLDDIDEKRLALSTILQLDPENTYAKGQMTVEDRKKATQKGTDDADLVPGITRGEARRVGLMLAGFTLVVCTLSFLIVSANNGYRDGIYREGTAAAMQGTRLVQTQEGASTQAAETATQVQFFIGETATAMFTPPTSTPRTPDLPPTFTPSPQPTDPTFALAYPTPPPSLGGRIMAWGGRNPISDTFLNLREYAVNQAGQFRRLNSHLAQFPHVDASGDKVVYMRVLSDNVSWVLSLNNANAPSDTFDDLDVRWSAARLTQASNPKLSRNGARLAFSALNPQTNSFDVFVYDFGTSELIQLTNEAANYTMPAISPDGLRVVAVRDAGAGPDLVLINIADVAQGFTPVPITSDGAQFAESNPDFSPQGDRIVYHATAAGRPEDADIWVLRLQQGSAATPLISTTFNERYPIFGPDGNTIAYTANHTGIDNIFLFDITARQTYQLTLEQDAVYAGGWTN